MKRIYSHLFFAMLIGLSLTACEQEIDIKLNETEPKVIIEGWVSDQPGPYTFKLGHSASYLGTGKESPISGATLILSDEMGTRDTLVEQQPGWYNSTTFRGQQQHNYFLEVQAEGEVYMARDYLPRVNNISASGYEYIDTLIFGEGYYVGILAQEPAGIGDFYQFRYWRNDSLFNSINDLIVSDDRLVDGNLSPFLFPYPNELGDTIVVEIRAISQATYDFFQTFYQQASGGSPFGSAPDNLKTNFDNGALGWFGAAAVVRDTIIIQ